MSSNSNYQKGRSWRSAFHPLRDPSVTRSLSSLLTALQSLLSNSRALVSAAPYLARHEISADIMLLVDCVSNEGVACMDTDSFSIITDTCHMIVDLSCRSLLELKPPFLVNMIKFACTIVERFSRDTKYVSSSPNTTLHNVSRHRLRVEALQVLRHIMHENAAYLSTKDAANIVVFLLGIVSCKGNQSSFLLSASPIKAPSGRYPCKGKIMDVDVEIETLCWITISNIFVQAESAISRDTWKLTIETLKEVMDIVALKSQLEEDNTMSRYYAAFLYCLQSVLSGSKGFVAENVSGLVTSLQKFFTYGLSGSIPKAPVCIQSSSNSKSNLDSSPASKLKVSASYRPPHLRHRHESLTKQFSMTEKTTVLPQSKNSVPSFSSDSDLSDTDVGQRERDSFKSSKARIAAILCIQALSRLEPKSVLAQWTAILPTHDVLHPWRYQPTLMTCLLFDPILKTRMAAAATLATMLEGPSSAFLQIAEVRETAKSGSFTTLSSSVGQTLMQLHTGLLYLVSNEYHSGFLMAILKALSLLVSATPYSRLPQDVLPDVISCLVKKATHLLPPSDVAAAINCLGAILSISPPLPQVANMLSLESSSGTLRKEKGSSLLSMLFSFTGTASHPVICSEALQALRAAVHSYPSILSMYWKEISSISLAFIESSNTESTTNSPLAQGFFAQNPKAVDDKTVLSAIKVLDEFLRSVSGFKGTDDCLDNNPSNSFQLLLPRPAKLPITFLSNGMEAGELGQKTPHCFLSGKREWEEALDIQIPLSLRDSAPMVRAAALTCFAGTTSSVFFSLPDAKQEFIISSIVTAALKDEVPSVRAAACRAIGVIASFPRLSASNIKLKVLVDAILANSFDPSVSVRITASWALGNICDSLRHNAGASCLEKSQMLDQPLLISLMECAWRLSRDGDKVKANAVRALGNLSRFLDFRNHMHFNPQISTYDKPFSISNSSEQKINETGSWLERMVQTFLSCVTTGNVKVQWNVCHALGNLFLNESIKMQEMTWSSSVYSILLLLLRDSSNFKIRIHAASALAVPLTREDYGSSFVDIIQSLIHSLETLDTDLAVSSSSFKYRNALTEQFSVTTLHIIGLARLDDYKTLSGFLAKKANFLGEWLFATCSKLAKSLHDDKNLQVGDISRTSREECDRFFDLEGKNSMQGLFSDHGTKPGNTLLTEPLIFKAATAIVNIFRSCNNQNLITRFEDIMSQFGPGIFNIMM